MGRVSVTRVATSPGAEPVAIIAGCGACEHRHCASPDARRWFSPCSVLSQPPSPAAPRPPPAMGSLPEARHPGVRRHGSRTRRAMDGRGQLPNMAKLAGTGRVVSARHDALARVAHRLGVVRDRREPRKAQHLRLPGPRHVHLPPRFRDGAARSRREVPLRLLPHRQAETSSRSAAARPSGSRRVEPACARACSPCRSRSLPKMCRTASCSSGLPLPDIRGTMGTFYYFATDLSRYEEGNTEFGGILKRLVVENDVAHTELVGPRTRSSDSRCRPSARKGRARATQDRDDDRRAAGA